jgi:general secretion pathway protein H
VRVRAHGFTLLEMLAVILLVGIAAAAVAVSVTRGLASARINAASSELAAALRATRTQAIIHGAERSFVLDTRDARYHGAGGRETSLPRGMRVGITSASMDQAGDGTARIRFFPDGSSTGGRITLESGRRQWHVNVSWLTGAVDVVDVVAK